MTATMSAYAVLDFIPEHLTTEVWPVSEEYLATLAAPVLERLRARKAEWDDDSRAQAEQGYRMTYCWHGTRMVFSDDRDAICGACEEGLSIEEEAAQIARDLWFDYCQRMQLWLVTARAAKAMGMEVPTRMDISWVCEHVSEES